MDQLTNTSPASSQMLHSSDNQTYTYKGSSVKVITVFNDSNGSVALVEDENGELFEVPNSALR